MNRRLKQFMVCLCAAVTITLCSTSEAAERVVIIAPAAADIVVKLNASELVVGVTQSVEEFPKAERVGTHINPCIECIVALNPTLIVSTERFAKEYLDRMHVEQYVYNPITVNSILNEITRLGARLNKEKEAATMLSGLQIELSKIKKPINSATMFYEVRSNPLSLAGENTIVSNALEMAGMVNLFKSVRTSAVSPEFVMTSQPDYYIYQEGPMNVNPISPKKRTGWNKLNACVWKVDEKAFSRANTNVIYELVRINGILNSSESCARGGE